MFFIFKKICICAGGPVQGRASKARGLRRFGAECTPHSLFGAPKRERAVHGPREKTPAVGLSVGFQESFCPRRGAGGGFGGPGHSLRRFPLALHSSVSGARRAGFASTSSVDRRRELRGGLEVPDTICVDFRLHSRVASAGLGGLALLRLPTMPAAVCTRGKPIQRTRIARAGRRLQLWWQSARTAPVL